MFSGIVESCQEVLKTQDEDQSIRLFIKKPSEFNDLSLGDSIAVNGVCLTLEEDAGGSMRFTVAAETLHITGWTAKRLQGQLVNLERSLCLGKRIHGHLVSGHVDAMGVVQMREQKGEALEFWVRFPEQLASMIWQKGSVALNGVSLTVNGVRDSQLHVCLVPETLRRTNLSTLKTGDKVCLEADYFARGYLHWLSQQKRGLFEQNS